MMKPLILLCTLLAMSGCTSMSRIASGAGQEVLAVDHLDVSTSSQKATIHGSPEGNRPCRIIQPARANRIVIDAGAVQITVSCQRHFSDPFAGHHIRHSTYQLEFVALAGHSYQVEPGESKRDKILDVELIDISTQQVVANSSMEYTVPESDKARIYCSGCPLSFYVDPYTGGRTIPAGTLRLRIKWGWNSWRNVSEERTDATIEHNFLGGHTYLIQQGVRPDREFAEAPAHDECALFVDWTEQRKFISCTPTTFYREEGINIKAPGDLSTSASTSRLICEGCWMVFDGVYSDVIVDAGPIKTTVGEAEVEFFAEPGATYFLSHEPAPWWNPEFEEPVLRAKLWNPTSVIKNEKARKEPWVRNCFLIVNWTETREFVDCIPYGRPQSIPPLYYYNNRALVEKVHAELRSAWAM